VTKAGGTATLTNGFTVVAMPTLATVSPSQAVQGQALSVTLTGTNLLGVTTVSFGSGINRQQLHCGQQHPDNGQHHRQRISHARRQGCLGDQCRRTATLTSGFVVNQAPRQ